MTANAQFSKNGINNVDMDLEEDETYTRSFNFSTSAVIVTDLHAHILDACEKLMRKFENYSNTSSAFKLDGVLEITFKFSAYNPVTHYQAGSFIATPTNLRNKLCTINVENKGDNKCFLYSILAQLHPCEIHKNRVVKYEPFLNELVYNGLDFPMRPSVENIKKFECLNNNKFATNVYKWTDETNKHVTVQGNPFVTVECISKNMNPDAIPINLAVLNACVDGIEKWHYVLINNFDRFMNIRVRHGKSDINIHQKWCPR